MPNATLSNQVALANRNRVATTNARNNRQVVPAFLQKLHECVLKHSARIAADSLQNG